MVIAVSLVLKIVIMEERKSITARQTAFVVSSIEKANVFQSELHALFGCPIYDRFNVVLSIFQLFAQDELARLQIALARVPYIR